MRNFRFLTVILFALFYIGCLIRPALEVRICFGKGLHRPSSRGRPAGAHVLVRSSESLVAQLSADSGLDEQRARAQFASQQREECQVEQVQQVQPIWEISPVRPWSCHPGRDRRTPPRPRDTGRAVFARGEQNAEYEQRQLGAVVGFLRRCSHRGIKQ